jgi:hypothetical protein
MLQAPPYDEIFAATSVFGTLIAHSPGEPSAPRARLWLLVDPHEPELQRGRLVVYRADPSSGQLARDDLGLIASAWVSPQEYAVETAEHGKFTGAVASCVCGGGAIAYAGPVETRHVVTYVRTDALSWLTVR